MLDIPFMHNHQVTVSASTCWYSCRPTSVGLITRAFIDTGSVVKTGVGSNILQSRTPDLAKLDIPDRWSMWTILLAADSKSRSDEASWCAIEDLILETFCFTRWKCRKLSNHALLPVRCSCVRALPRYQQHLLQVPIVYAQQWNDMQRPQ